jgi:DNA polymerase-3 subunit delta
VRLKPAALRAFLDAPDPAFTAALVYGPDQGLVAERARRLVAATAGEPPDPFRYTELDAATLRSDPGRIEEEACSLSFGIGRRAVRVRAATDALAPGFARALNAAAAPGTLLVADAGDLPKRSALRRLFEEASAAVAIACYEDDAQSLHALIDETLTRRGYALDDEAADLLVSLLGADRAASRSELEKLAVYIGPPAAIGADAVRAVVSEAGAPSLEAVAYAACSGASAACDRALADALAEGAAPVTVLRALARHLQRLWFANEAAGHGRSPRQAMQSLRPPVLYRMQDDFARQMRLWPRGRVAQALDLLTEAELDCKTTGAPAAAIAGRTAMRIAQAGESAARGARQSATADQGAGGRPRSP